MDKPRKHLQSVLVIGIGNTLLSDDGFGVHVVDALRASEVSGSSTRLLDGGTIGLSLLPDIEDADHLIVVDAAELNEQPGTLRVFAGEDMDAHLSRHKSTVHEVAMSDLLCAARLSGNSPLTRFLVAVQPSSTDWGLNPTAQVQAAVEAACALVNDRIAEVAI